MWMTFSQDMGRLGGGGGEWGKGLLAYKRAQDSDSFCELDAEDVFFQEILSFHRT
jgi:hypothetical protein